MVLGLLEKVFLRFDPNKYFVITMDKDEFEAYINLDGVVSNFINLEINKANYQEIFEQYLNEGDLLIDFADSVGTRDICVWCAERNIMYLNTGEADWPENWYSIFNENQLKLKMKEVLNKDENKNLHPIVLQHGNNPGLVSHFVKAGINYIVNTQFKRDKEKKQLLKAKKYNELAKNLGIKTIHVNDIDLQNFKRNYEEGVLFNTWCTETFFFELLSESTFNIGTHEKIDYQDECNLVDLEKGFLEFKKIAASKRGKTYYPNGAFEAYLVPHEETITIAQGLEVKEDDKIIYRPTVMFLYQPCEFAARYLKEANVNDYINPDPNKPKDCDEENENGEIIVRGFKYPKSTDIAYEEDIKGGTEYVGVLIMGENFKPVWVGNRIELNFLYKDKETSYCQTPTITPVAMSALAATCWMIKNKDKKGIFFPDDIKDYEKILKLAEKYISPTIYETFEKDLLEKTLKIDFSSLQAKDFFIS